MRPRPSFRRRGEDIAALRVVVAESANELGDERDPALLGQLVVHGLIEVAEHVHVAPTQLDADAVLESGGHRPPV
jgi:ribulose 1,5-bisphosphate synthetase/thiazole synthase